MSAPVEERADSASLALAGVTATVAVGMARLFEDHTFLVPVLATAAVAHAVSWGARRARLSLPASALLAAAASLLSVVWLVLPATTAFGLPTGATLGEAGRALAAAWQSFPTVVAPAPVTPGFLIAAMVGVATAAILADWAAFRVNAILEPVVPSFTLFLFTAILGTARHRGLAVVGYLAAVLAFLLVQQANVSTASSSWFASRSRGGPAALLQGGALLGCVALLGAVVVAPHLPGNGDPPLVDWRDGGDGPSRRTTTSPLVDIRGRLVEQSTSEVFTVRSSEPAYWRLTSLDTFDGSVWQSNDSYRPVRRRLPADVPAAPNAEEVVQEFTITGLASIWLPAAYRPERIEGVDGASYNADSGSLISRQETSDGLRYRVLSELPRLTRGELTRVGTPERTPDLLRYLQLPPVSPRVRRLAADVAARNPTPYGRALALQSLFRDNFEYDLKARPGHDGRALERFLFDTRTGYCEQFAGSYAVLARLMGLPSRVAVGFTQGELGSDGLWHVRGLHAHAWPEVYLEGYGWTYFEPTPGRGAPGTEPYTGVPTLQASAENPATATTAPPPTAAPAPSGDDGQSSTTMPQEDTFVSDGDEAQRSLLSHPLVRALLALGILTAAWVVAVPAARRARVSRRRSGARTPADRVLVAWEETEEALSEAGAGRRRSETVDEYAQRVPPAVGLAPPARDALAALARDVAAASYAAGRLPDDVAGRAAACRDTVVGAVRGALPARRRALNALDPRPLLPHPVRHRVTGRSRQAA